MRSRTAFLFDLDGTILDSAADLAAAANVARAALGLPPLPVPDVVGMVGRGLAALLADAIPPDLHARIPEAREAFVAHYRANLLVHTRPFPGVEAMLDALAGHPLGVVTNKPGMFTHPILAGLGWTTRFGAVVTGDCLPTRKPAPEPLLHGLALLGVRPEQAVFVGDTLIDRDTARAAGVRFACVAWGRAAGACEAVVERLERLAEQFG